jgi:hypothetical protein
MAPDGKAVPRYWDSQRRISNNHYVGGGGSGENNDLGALGPTVIKIDDVFVGQTDADAAGGADQKRYQLSLTRPRAG